MLNKSAKDISNENKSNLEKKKGGGPKMAEERARRPLSPPQIHQKNI